uniref:NADH dehydrogenase subunit 3 n=1 Tax=Arorathrips mexicanus TaxID=1291224 RepID=UPI0030DE9BFC
MLIMIISVFSMLLLSSLLFYLTFTISKKTKSTREKSISFECGFNLFNISRTPFSMRFFLIAIIFIIFDVEIALILPIIPTIFKTSIFKWTLTSIIFLLIILMGIFIEWKENTFEWKT